MKIPTSLISHRIFFQAEDVEYFKFRAVNRSVVSVKLAKPLDTLVDGPNPQSVLKFRMVCDYDDEDETVIFTTDMKF